MYTGIKTTLVNSYAALPHQKLMLKNGNTAGTIANATKMILGGFGEFALNQVSNVKASRGFSASKQVYTFTPANIAEYSISAPAVATYVYFAVTRRATEYQAQYGENQMQFSKEKSFQIKLPSTITNDAAGAQVLAKAVYEAINYEIARFGAEDLGFTVSYTGTLNAMTTLVFTSLTEKLEITKFRVTDDEGQDSDIVTKFAPVLSTARTEGRATGLILQENEFLLTAASTMPYNGASNRILANPVSNYTTVSFDLDATIDHRGLHAMGQTLNARTSYVIYIEETSENLGSPTVTNGQLVSNGIISAVLQVLGKDGKRVDGYSYYNANFGNPASAVSTVLATGATAWVPATHSGVVRTNDNTLAADVTTFLS